ncbi:MAG: pyruvate kinase [Oligoflexia bacterium]|nr:pyruvate kinase [Oligoflexia bacterium]
MIADRRTKIVATIGPASQSPEMLHALVEAGVNVARLNFSHGSHQDHLKVIQTLREIAKAEQAPVALLQDLQGPKIRVGKMKDGGVTLKDGQSIVVTTDKILGDSQRISTDFLELPRDVSQGTQILLDDGNLEFLVEKVDGHEVHCKVVVGGLLKDNKGMNIPGARLTVDPLTEKDLKDLEFGISQGVEYIALSFVRQGRDIRQLRELIENKGSAAKIIAKIEKIEALDNLEEIVSLADGVMVARGDLAVEIGQSLLPGKQKKIIKLCNALGKPVITATQMLDSMVNNPRPTRAEVTDIANAVLDGTDAVMLSAETASGKYPVRCVETMAEIIKEVEKTDVHYYNMNLRDEYLTVAEAIAESACLSAMKLNASSIVCLTTSGKTATLISQFRPKAKIVAVTHKMETLNRLELVWGIEGIPIEPYDDTDAVMLGLEKSLLNYGLCKPGDKVILTMGVPVLERGTTNSVRVYTIKDQERVKLNPKALPLRVRKDS